MTANILLVDDEIRVLEAYKRAFRKEFQLDTATGGQEALDKMVGGEPYQVVISDMRMPGMNGVEFLAEAKRRFPDTVRMMLTGNSDQRTAIDAINTGDVFRFINKPCPPPALAAAINDGLRQYELVTAERELLENTLRGSIEVYSELLALQNPKSFGFTVLVKRYAREVAEEMGIADIWWIEVLAMLSQIGCVTLPGVVQDKVAAGAPLLEDESRSFEECPSVGANLIAGIPRLETMAEAIRQQATAYDGQAADDRVVVGARILKAVVDFARARTVGDDDSAILARLTERRGDYDPRVLDSLERVVSAEAALDTRTVKLASLTGDMLLAEDIYSKTTGVRLVCRGQELTASIRQHLASFADNGEADSEFPIKQRAPRLSGNGPASGLRPSGSVQY